MRNFHEDVRAMTDKWDVMINNWHTSLVPSTDAGVSATIGRRDGDDVIDAPKLVHGVDERSANVANPHCSTAVKKAAPCGQGAA